MLAIDSTMMTRWITSRRGGLNGVHLCATPAVTVTALVPVGISSDDEPTVNSQDELAVATTVKSSNPLRRLLYFML